MTISWERCVFSSRGLCDVLITRPENSECGPETSTIKDPDRLGADIPWINWNENYSVHCKWGCSVPQWGEGRGETRSGRAMKEEGLFGSADRACLRACFCVCVKWEIFIVNSAIQRAIAIKLRATEQQPAIPLAPQFLPQLCSCSSKHNRAYFDALLHARSTTQLLPHLQPLSIPVLYR